MKHVLIAVVALHAAGAALAQSAAASATATGSATATAVAFQCGGVGDADQRRMKAEAAQHDLMLTFSTNTGAYLADIDVEISSGGKVVLQGRCDGPLMLVDVPRDGKYQVRASSDGRQQSKTVTVGGKPASVSFVWPGS